MEAVIKVGGSLSENSASLKNLGTELSLTAKKHRVVFVPGGGRFADAVRDLDERFSLPALVSHKLAITSMDQFGFFLTQMIPNSVVCDSIESAESFSKKKKAVVFLPSKLLMKFDPFEPSWDVTADSISAYIAVKLKAPKVIFVTDVDGVFASDPKKNPGAKLISEISVCTLQKDFARTCVDRFLPIFLAENKLDAYVVNGNFPQRINDIIAGKSTICTRIV